ncbi:MAG: right-handed parallel beta-helix repeat-containing protein [Streptosporangiaceae bacterium]
MAKNRHPDRDRGVRRRGYTVVIALAFFLCLGGLPTILSALHLKINVAPPASSDGIRLLPAPSALSSVPLPPAARPVDPWQPPATLPGVSESQEAAAVSAQDNWLRAMLHDSFRSYQPMVVQYGGSLPTLVLTSGAPYSSSGVATDTAPSPTYTATDLIQYGALVPLPHGAALLEDNIFVAAGAHLELSSSDVRALYLDDTPAGSASIVGWRGSLAFRGTSNSPLTVEGWDEATMTPAKDTGRGRPYIREVAGRMTFANVRASFLGFWSGRTGGVAWTGLANYPSTGGATSTTFTGNTYGAFVTRSEDVRFSADLFESNQLDGFHVHRGTVGASATLSSAVRNGENGFHVDRGSNGTVLQDDVSQHNAANGFVADGRPLVSTASPSGNAVAPGSGTRIENSAALGNAGTGILVEGGTAAVLKADEVCAKQTGIALRYGASKTIVNGNDVRCGPRVGLSIGPTAPATLVSGNAVSGARIAVVVRSSGSVEVDNSLITQGTVFGISIRGANSVVSGKDNVISGTGYRAVDVRADAVPPALSGSNTADWAPHEKGTFLTYLEFHPLAILWLSIVFLVIVGGLWTRRRRPPQHPYPESTQWIGPAADPGRQAPVLVAAAKGGPDGPSWSGNHDASPRGAGAYGRALYDPGLPDATVPDGRRPFERVGPAGGVPHDRRLEYVLPDGRDAGGYPRVARHGSAEQIDATCPLPRVADRP